MCRTQYQDRASHPRAAPFRSLFTVPTLDAEWPNSTHRSTGNGLFKKCRRFQGNNMDPSLVGEILASNLSRQDTVSALRSVCDAHVLHALPATVYASFRW